MNDIRTRISKNLAKLGKQYVDLKIRDSSLKQKSIDDVISTSYLNFDFSKQRIDKQAFEWLLSIPDQLNLRDHFSMLLDGNFDNPSEKRKVSHTLYRLSEEKKGFEQIFSERNKISNFFEKVYSRKNIKNLICIGIGGSRLGPELLNQFQARGEPFNIFFCSSYDLLELKDALKRCDQSETIFLASSKSFATSEILKNLDFVKEWFSNTDGIDYLDQLFGVSSDTEAMDAFGIKKENQFIILESLGGRYSLWSSMSLPAFINSDFKAYQSFLEGGNAADKYVMESEWQDNISMIMALLSIWNTSALGINNHGIFTYNYRMRSFTSYVAQLSMESNGKSIDSDFMPSPLSASPLIWGGYGFDSQHSTFQWMMQGTTNTSCDFIGVNNDNEQLKDSYQMMLSQVLAMTLGENNEMEPHKSVRGNNPCSVIQLHSLDLKTIGFLIALYEHKVFFEGLILGINSFDQWGVQLGKKLALNSKENSEFLSNYFSSELLPKS
tara:strand:+ start:1157 stop:2641 length:1485 start_codon:yes stop_codon:yes gene_type:complete